MELNIIRKNGNCAVVIERDKPINYHSLMASVARREKILLIENEVNHVSNGVTIERKMAIRVFINKLEVIREKNSRILNLIIEYDPQGYWHKVI